MTRSCPCTLTGCSGLVIGQRVVQVLPHALAIRMHVCSPASSCQAVPSSCATVQVAAACRHSMPGHLVVEMSPWLFLELLGACLPAGAAGAGGGPSEEREEGDADGADDEVSKAKFVHRTPTWCYSCTAECLKSCCGPVALNAVTAIRHSVPKNLGTSGATTVCCCQTEPKIMPCCTCRWRSTLTARASRICLGQSP